MVESDWHIIDKEIVDQSNPKDASLHLEKIVREFE
jgi:hypothetical protein